MLKYKIDVIDALKKAGYNSTAIYNDRQISQSAMQKLRKGEMVGIKTLAQMCQMLNLQPGDIVEYVFEDSENNLKRD